MIKLFSLKQQKKDGTDTTARTGQKKATAAQLRITKGSQLLLPVLVFASYTKIMTNLNSVVVVSDSYCLLFAKKPDHT